MTTCPLFKKSSRGIEKCGSRDGRCNGVYRSYTCSLKQEQPETKEVEG